MTVWIWDAWILVEAIRAMTLLPSVADALVEALRSTGARLPHFSSGGIETWGQRQGLLPLPRGMERVVRLKPDRAADLTI